MISITCISDFAYKIISTFQLSEILKLNHNAFFNINSHQKYFQRQILYLKYQNKFKSL